MKTLRRNASEGAGKMILNNYQNPGSYEGGEVYDISNLPLYNEQGEIIDAGGVIEAASKTFDQRLNETTTLASVLPGAPAYNFETAPMTQSLPAVHPLFNALTQINWAEPHKDQQMFKDGNTILQLRDGSYHHIHSFDEAVRRAQEQGIYHGESLQAEDLVFDAQATFDAIQTQSGYSVEPVVSNPNYTTVVEAPQAAPLQISAEFAAFPLRHGNEKSGDIFRYEDSPDKLYRRGADGIDTEISLTQAQEYQRSAMDYAAAKANPTAAQPVWLTNQGTAAAAVNHMETATGGDFSPLSVLTKDYFGRKTIDNPNPISAAEMPAEAAAVINFEEKAGLVIYDSIKEWGTRDVASLAKSISKRYPNHTPEAVAVILHEEGVTQNEVDRFGAITFDITQPFSYFVGQLNQLPGLNKVARVIHRLEEGQGPAPTVQGVFENYATSALNKKGDRGVFEYQSSQAAQTLESLKVLFNAWERGSDGIPIPIVGHLAGAFFGDVKYDEVKEIIATLEDPNATVEQQSAAMDRAKVVIALEAAETNTETARKMQTLEFDSRFTNGSKVVYDPKQGGWNIKYRHGGYGTEPLSQKQALDRMHPSVDRNAALAKVEKAAQGELHTQAELATAAGTRSLERSDIYMDASAQRLAGRMPYKRELSIITQRVASQQAARLGGQRPLTLDQYTNAVLAHVDQPPRNYVEHADAIATFENGANVYHGNLEVFKGPNGQRNVADLAGALKSQYLKFDPDNVNQGVRKSPHSAYHYVLRTLARNGVMPSTAKFDQALNSGTFKSVSQIPVLMGHPALNTAPGSQVGDSMLEPQMLSPHEEIYELPAFTESFYGGVMEVEYKIFIRENCANPVIVQQPKVYAHKITPEFQKMVQSEVSNFPQIPDDVIGTESQLNIARLLVDAALIVGGAQLSKTPSTPGAPVKNLTVAPGGGGGTILQQPFVLI